MKALRFLLPAIAILLLSQGCGQKSLIRSKTRQADIDRMLEVQKALTANSLVQPWKVFDQKLPGNERQALEFLYAYMPLSDLADYTPEFFLANIRKSLEAREEMSWGHTIPEEVFLHFVLPLRVNNENLDSFRLVMYDEIRDRVKHLNMKEAALEINHWCHEKVTYRPTDIRTSAPLSTVRKSFGRCGEESTFTVTALRTAGIPARQVYTPRWAHTDDNHAWVEVWADGTWYFMGACEPEPVLNRGWFSEPSRRVMLVHTRAYGRYSGNETVIHQADRFSELNLTATYAPVKNCTVVVTRADGTPAPGVQTDFGLYNYAEFYPIASIHTDAAGTATFLTGLGDLLIRASDGTSSASRAVTVSESDTVRLVLSSEEIPPHTEEMDLIPPHSVRADTALSDAVREANRRRLSHEDSLRQAYMATFKDSAWSARLASRLHLDADTVRNLIQKSYGNWSEIERYLVRNADTHRNTVLLLATRISDKDLSDTRAAVLNDHLENTPWPEGMDASTYSGYLLSPRIANEILSPWRSLLRDRLIGKDLPEGATVADLIGWIRQHIVLNEEANLHSRAPITPEGVYNLRVADRLSRDIFLVAACRSLGIAARINTVTGKTETLEEGEWNVISLDEGRAPETATGQVLLTPASGTPDLRYYSGFTLGRLTNGFFRTLEFDEGRALSGLPKPLLLEPGTYRLITGNRRDDGSVLATLTYFRVEPNATVRVPVTLRSIATGAAPLGAIDPQQIVLNRGGKPESLSSLVTGRDFIVVLYDPDKEPSKHVLQEISSYAGHFEKWKGILVFVTAGKTSTTAGGGFPLPANRIDVSDNQLNLLKVLETLEGKELTDRLPLVIFCSAGGDVGFSSSGYRIGIGEQLLRLAR